MLRVVKILNKGSAKIRDGLSRASCGSMHTGSVVASSHFLCDALIGLDVPPPVQFALLKNEGYIDIFLPVPLMRYGGSK